MKPDGVDKVDKVENEISKEGEENKRFSPVSVRNGPSKQCENDSWNTLQNTTLGLKSEGFHIEEGPTSVPALLTLVSVLQSEPPRARGYSHKSPWNGSG